MVVETAQEVVRWQLPKSTPLSLTKTSPVVLEATPAYEAGLAADSVGATIGQKQMSQQVASPAVRMGSSAFPPPLQLPPPSPTVSGFRTCSYGEEKNPAATDRSGGGGAVHCRQAGSDQDSDSLGNANSSSLHTGCESDEGRGSGRVAGVNDISFAGNIRSGGGEILAGDHDIGSAEGVGDVDRRKRTS